LKFHKLTLHKVSPGTFLDKVHLLGPRLLLGTAIRSYATEEWTSDHYSSQLAVLLSIYLSIKHHSRRANSIIKCWVNKPWYAGQRYRNVQYVARVDQRVGTIASDWFLNDYRILGITKLIGLLELYVYYVYKMAMVLVHYQMQSTALIYFSQFWKLLNAAGNVTCNTRPIEPPPPPPIISICISKTHKITRKVQKQFKFSQIYSWVPQYWFTSNGLVTSYPDFFNSISPSKIWHHYKEKWTGPCLHQLKAKHELLSVLAYLVHETRQLGK
jgi:hypothetical protein